MSLLPSDESILRAIYSEGNGPFWADKEAVSTWLNSSVPPCLWKGVGCLVENGTGVGRVGKLDFTGFGVTALSGKVGGLGRLYHLDLDGNRLTRVPESIGSLGELRILYFHNNQLQSISETIGQLTNLQELYILLFNHRICTFRFTLSFSQDPLQQPAPVHPRDHRPAHEPPRAVHFAIQSSHLHL